MEEIRRNTKYIEYCEDIKRKEKMINSFYNSPIFNKLANDIKRVGVPFASYEWKFFPEKIRNIYGWGEDIYDQHINAFLMCLGNSFLPIENENENSFLRSGLNIKIVIEDEIYLIVSP